MASAEQAEVPARLYYSIAEVAALLSVSTKTIKRRIARGEIHTKPYGRRKLIPATELQRIHQVIEDGDKLPVVQLDLAPLDLSLTTEVRALVTRLHELREEAGGTIEVLARQNTYYRQMLTHGYDVWDRYEKDPAHPELASFTWMREWLVQTAEYWVNATGADPFAEERAWSLSLIDRILASERAVAHAG